MDSPHCSDPSKSVDHPRDTSAGIARKDASSFSPKGMRLTPETGRQESQTVRPHNVGYPATTRPLYRSCPTPINCGVHTLNQNKSERSQIRTPIVVHGRLEGSTDGIWVLPKTITGATYTSSQRREHTEYLGRPNCSPNIAKYRV